MIRWYGATDKGSRRPTNQDALWAGWNDGDVQVGSDYRATTQGRSERFRGFVADGMGGGLAGDVASSLAASIAERRIGVSPGILLEDIHREIVEEGLTDTSKEGMATTGVLLDIVDGRARWAHVGDSLYVVHTVVRNLQRLTKDHSEYQVLVDAGIINEGDSYPRNIIRYILGREIGNDVPTNLMDVCPGDLFLLCSDGVTEVYDDSALEKELLAGSMEAAVDRIVARSCAEGRDNVTALGAWVEG